MLTDGAVKNLAYMGIVSRGFVNDFSVYAGYIGFTRDGSTDTYSDPLAHNVNQPGAAEGPGFRHQTYEPVPIGYAISPPDDDSQLSSSPVWAVDQAEWERLGGRTAGTTTADEVTLGELAVGRGVVRVVGALRADADRAVLPPVRAREPRGHLQRLSGAAERPAVGAAAAGPHARGCGHLVHRRSRSRRRSRRPCGTLGTVAATGVPVRFTDNGTQIGAVQTIASIPAGGSGTASVVWSMKKLKGDRTDRRHRRPGECDRRGERDEQQRHPRRDREAATRCKNGDFQQSTNGAPDYWSGSGSTSYDGNAASAGPGGSWTSAANPGRGGDGRTTCPSTSSGAAVLSSSSSRRSAECSRRLRSPRRSRHLPGSAQVRIVLKGGLTSSTAFDNVWMSER